MKLRLAALAGALVSLLTFLAVSAADDDTAVSFSYLIDDGVAAPVEAGASLDITPVNDAPVNLVPGNQKAAANASTALSDFAVLDVDSAVLTTTLTMHQIRYLMAFVSRALAARGE